MSLIINPGFTIGPGTTLHSGKVVRSGLSPDQASTSAWQIKQDFPNSPTGLYWIQNANINGGAPVQIYADMTTLGGGWTLIMQNNYYDWVHQNAFLRNSTTPPTSLVNGGINTTFGTDGSANYSIIGWADYIKRSPSGFDYMFDAYTRGYNGGAWTANSAYSFLDEVDLIAYQAQGTAYFGTDPINGKDGFHQNISEIARFPAGGLGDTATWTYDNNGIEHRMPWLADTINVGGALFTTTHDDGNSWWGTLMDQDRSFTPAPWINGGVTGTVSTTISAPNTIWYWVR